MKQNRDITYIPTDLTDDAIGEASTADSNYKLLLGKHNQEIGNILVMPYCYKKHWLLLIVDVKTQLTLLASYEGSNDADRVESAFIKFIDKCTVTSPFCKLKNINWTI